MNSPKSLKENQAVDITDLYALRIRALWSALKFEHLSLWMLCIYFFFEYIRPQSLYPVLDVLPWAQIFLFAAMSAAFFDKSVHWVSNIENKLLILFSFIVILSGVFAFRPADSLNNWAVFGGWFIVYFLVVNVVNTEKRLILFLLAYCLFSFKMSQHGAVSWAMRGFTFTSYGLIGSPGWFRNSGEYAIQMLIFGSLATAIIISLKEYLGRNQKLFYFAVAATGFMAVMGSSSRGAQIGLAAIGVWWILKLKGGFKALIVISIIGAVLFNILPDEQVQRFYELGEDKSSLQRIAYWEYGLSEVIAKYPVLGVGYKNWLGYVSFMVPEGMGPYMIVQEPHNIFIQAASEEGILGLFVFLLLIIFAFINNSRTRSMTKGCDNKLLYNLSYGFDAGLIGFLVAGSFVTVLYYPFFWIQIAMIVMLNNIASLNVEGKLSGS